MMQQDEDREYAHYYKRLEEFDGIFKLMESDTMRQLISTAKARTKDGLEHLLQMNKVTVMYLTAHDIEVKKRLPELQAYLNEYRLRNDEKALDTLGRQIKLESEVHNLIITIYPMCLEEFKRVLLEYIYKPDNSSFNYESVIDLLNIVASKLIPGLEGVKAIRKFIPSIRKKEFARSGDKLVLYIEQYMDALKQWRDLGTAYIDIVCD